MRLELHNAKQSILEPEPHIAGCRDLQKVLAAMREKVHVEDPKICRYNFMLSRSHEGHFLSDPFLFSGQSLKKSVVECCGSLLPAVIHCDLFASRP